MSAGEPPFPTITTTWEVAPTSGPFEAVAVAEFMRVVETGGAWAEIVMVAVAPGASVPSSAVTSPADSLQLPCDALQEANASPGGS